MANARFILPDGNPNNGVGDTRPARMNRQQLAAIQAADSPQDHYALAPTLKRTSGRATPAPAPIANTVKRSGKASTPQQSRASKPIPTVPLS